MFVGLYCILKFKFKYMIQIMTYLERWCSSPPNDIESTIDQQELRQLYNHIIQPSWYDFRLYIKFSTDVFLANVEPLLSQELLVLWCT
jgi:hypothetical protein